MPTSIRLCYALLAFVLVAAATRAEADALTDGAKNYKPFAVEHIPARLPAPKNCKPRSRRTTPKPRKPPG